VSATKRASSSHRGEGSARGNVKVGRWLVRTRVSVGEVSGAVSDGQPDRTGRLLVRKCDLSSWRHDGLVGLVVDGRKCSSAVKTC
jgi:hypothetical protein